MTERLEERGREVIGDAIDLIFQLTEEGEVTGASRADAPDHRLAGFQRRRFPAGLAEVAGLGPCRPEPGRLRSGSGADGQRRLTPAAGEVPGEAGEWAARRDVPEERPEAVDGPIPVVLQAMP